MAKSSSHAEKMIAFARDLIRIPSASGAEGAVAKRIVKELQKLKFDDVWTDEVGNVLGRIKGTGKAPSVMLCSHMDVVDVGDTSGWEHDPFAADMDDQFLYGRGAMDIKGPLALQAYAAATFVENRAPGDIVVAFTVFEEKGGWGMEHLLTNGSERPGAIILGEATNGDINIGHRGRAELIVEIRGVAAHASAPERGKSPIDVLERVLPVIRNFARGLGQDDILGRSTAVATHVQSFPESRNIIPETVRLTIDWRVLPGIDAEAATSSFARLIARHIPAPEGYTVDVRFATTEFTAYTGLTRERRLFTPGFLIDAQHPIVRAAAGVISSATGQEPVTKPWTFATDGGHASVYGIPCIGYAPGDERLAHTNRERIELAQMRSIFETYPDVVRAVQLAL